jgi:MFS transporter, OFA family, oxalate/formate antiporter
MQNGTCNSRNIRGGIEISTASGSAEVHARTSGWTRWSQLVLGIVCLGTIANLQYGWTLFINPIEEKYHWGRAAIQVTFTILIVTETWVAPIAGYLIDRFGPRVIVCGSGALVATAWIINSVADSLVLFYLAALIAGFGAGPIFAATVGNALKWFPDRRGLATGLTAAGFGAGSALTVVPLANMIQSSGYEAAYLWFGLGQGIVIMVVALLLRTPQQAEVASFSARVPQSKYDYAPADVLRSHPFWLMYAMFVMVGTGGGGANSFWASSAWGRSGRAPSPHRDDLRPGGLDRPIGATRSGGHARRDRCLSRRLRPYHANL